MLRRKIFVSLVQCSLLVLCLVPQAAALGAETNLPNTASCLSANAGTETAMSATALAPSIQDVWMQQGGARLYYSALYGARQQYTGGASRIDPACSPLLPPMRAWGAPQPKKRSVPRRVAKAAVPCPEVVAPVAVVGADAAASTSKGGAAAATAAASAASSAAQSRAEAIAKAKAASAAEAATMARTAKSKPAKAAKPAATSPAPAQVEEAAAAASTVDTAPRTTAP